MTKRRLGLLVKYLEDSSAVEVNKLLYDLRNYC